MGSIIASTPYGGLPVVRRTTGPKGDWRGYFNLDNLASNIATEVPYLFAGAFIRQEEGVYKAFPAMPAKIDIELASKLVGIDEAKVYGLLAMRAVSFNTIDELVLYLNLDFVLKLSTSGDDGEIEAAVHELLSTGSGSSIRGTLFEPIKTGIVIRRGGMPPRRVGADLASLIDEIGLPYVELPHDFDRESTLAFFHRVDRFFNHIGLEKEARTFLLRFRRLGAYRANGYYSFQANTIIVDPRFTDTFVHELAHFVYDNGLKLQGLPQEREPERFAVSFEHDFLPLFT